MFAISGAAAIGHVLNVFKYVDTTIPLQVTSLLPVELTIRDSFTCIPSMCVSGLGRWLVGKVHCVEHCVWLGVSFGSYVVSESVSLLETALALPRAAVVVDSRLQYP